MKVSKLRDAEAADVAEIIHIGRPVFESIFPIEGDAERIAAMLEWAATDVRGYLKVAEAEGEIVGFFVGAAAPFEPWSDKRCASELLFYIAPEHRGRLAVMMIRDFQAWARERGCALVSVSSQAGLDGERVGKLYRRMGFEPRETNYMQRID